MLVCFRIRFVIIPAFARLFLPYISNLFVLFGCHLWLFLYFSQCAIVNPAGLVALSCASWDRNQQRWSAQNKSLM